MAGIPSAIAAEGLGELAGNLEDINLEDLFPLQSTRPAKLENTK